MHSKEEIDEFAAKADAVFEAVQEIASGKVKQPHEVVLSLKKYGILNHAEIQEEEEKKERAKKRTMEDQEREKQRQREKWWKGAHYLKGSIVQEPSAYNKQDEVRM
jgi:hypothetical protein